MAAEPNLKDEMRPDVASLYREEMYTDRRVATIRVMVPVKVDGTDDPSRPREYLGQTQVMTQMGPLPIHAPIEAASLEEALQKFPDAVELAVQEMIEQAREMQRQEASRIVVADGKLGQSLGGKPGGSLLQL